MLCLTNFWIRWRLVKCRNIQINIFLKRWMTLIYLSPQLKIFYQNMSTKAFKSPQRLSPLENSRELGILENSGPEGLTLVHTVSLLKNPSWWPLVSPRTAPTGLKWPSLRRPRRPRIQLKYVVPLCRTLSTSITVSHAAQPKPPRCVAGAAVVTTRRASSKEHKYSLSCESQQDQPAVLHFSSKWCCDLQTRAHGSGI